MKVIKYDDLLKDYNSFNALKSYESFPLPIEGNLINKYELIEYSFEGLMSNRTDKHLFTNLVTDFKDEALQIMLNDPKEKVLFAIEHAPSPTSRIKSHKGLIDKGELNDEDFIQKEIILPNGKSRIAFVARVTHQNFAYLTKFFFDYSSCFIISSFESHFTPDFIDSVTSLFKIDGWAHINYLRVVEEFCSQNDFIYRIGADDGETCWSLQVFKTKD